MDYPTFNQLPTFWKVLIIIGFIATFIFIILLIIAISLMFETKNNKVDLCEYDDFMNEFMNNDNKEIIESIELIYPVLPKIKDFDGNYLLDLLQIEII